MLGEGSNGKEWFQLQKELYDQGLGQGVVLSVRVGVDEKANEQRVIKVDQPSLGLSSSRSCLPFPADAGTHLFPRIAIYPTGGVP